MVKLKQIDITSWSDKKLLRFLEDIQGDVVLIGEEDMYYVLVKEGIVVEEANSRMKGPNFFKYPIKEWINDLSRGIR